MTCLYNFTQGAKPTTQWQPWTINSHTAGHFEAWDDLALTYITVRGGGHELPTFQPLAAAEMFGRYINGKFTSASLSSPRGGTRTPSSARYSQQAFIEKFLEKTTK